jgi:hypothetical protein
MMLKGTSVAALALHGSDIAAGIPASLFEGNHTPKICLEAGMGDLPPAPGGVASDEVVAAASRRVADDLHPVIVKKTAGARPFTARRRDQAARRGSCDFQRGRIPWEEGKLKDMKYRGFAGAVIDTSVRDTPQIRKLQFPVFTRGVVPSTTINHYRVVGINVPVTCAGVLVNSGDIVVADEDGVAAVPRARPAEVLKKAQELDDTEHRMLPFIEKFRLIKEAVKRFGRI